MVHYACMIMCLYTVVLRTVSPFLRKSSFSMKSSTRWKSSWSADLDSRSVTKANIFGREIYIKRDDLFSFPALPTVAGNKVRKLHSLYYATEFPEIVISYGGVQSNAMRALAAVTKYRKSRFIYLTRSIPQQLLRNPIGSYREAIENNMEVCNYVHLAINANMSC